MFNTRLDYQICEYMVYCRSRQLRANLGNHFVLAHCLFSFTLFLLGKSVASGMLCVPASYLTSMSAAAYDLFKVASP